MKKVIISILILILVILLIFFLEVYNKERQPNNISLLDSENNNINEQYAVGDIILADSSIIKAKDFTTINNDNLPVAIIVGVKDNGAVFGLGVHRSNDCLQWTPDENNSSVFDFVSTYAETYKLTGEYASNWYIPSIEEVNMIYENRETINTSLQKIYELDNSAAMNGLNTNWYWSSSESASKDDYAWFVHFVNGYAGECPKDFTNLHVIVVRTF
ncbi:MAG: DUF1566 domain-containing protein [Clostridia bacterium]|nr:DUF1566 domain-containing protein [Clostridia bacterium]